LFPGDSIQLFKSADLSFCNDHAHCAVISKSALLFKSTTVSFPKNPLLPATALNIPTVQSSCSDLVFDLTKSVGDLGSAWRNITIQVSSVPSTTFNNHIQTVIQTHYSGQVTQLSPPFAIAHDYFKSNVNYSFSVKLCNFIGGCNTDHRMVRIVSDLIPTVTILGSSEREMTRSQSLLLVSSVQRFSCNDSGSKLHELKYNWKFFNLPHLREVASVKSISKDPSRYSLAPFSLQSNRSYLVSLEVIYSNITISATVLLKVNIGRVKAVIAGNSQQMMRIGDVFNVDGSRSYDEDKEGLKASNAGLTFSWSCSPYTNFTTSSCLKYFDDGLFQNSVHSPLLKLKANESARNLHVKISLLIEDIISKRTDVISVVLSVLPSLYPTILLSSNAFAHDMTNQINPGQALLLNANISFAVVAVTGNLTWISTGGLALATIASSPVFRAVGTSLPLRSTFHLALVPNSLTAGRLYSFGLKCQLENNIQVTSFISITVNAPPSPGRFVVSPTSGTAYLEVFLLTCSGWTDSDLPLSYQFSFLSLTGITLITKSLTSLSYSGTVLPEGQKGNNQLVTCQADIYDNINANATVFKSVEVRSLLKANISQLIRQNIDPRLAIDLDDLIKGVNIASSLLNAPNCSLSPNCTTLNRFSCLSTSHTCGPCVASFFSSFPGDGNEQCVKSVTGQIIINRQPKRCYLECSSRGNCIYFSHITRKRVETCFEGDLSCYSSCSCDEGYKMSNYCELSDKDTKEYIALRELVVDRIIANTKLQDPTEQAVSGWMNSLLEISQIPNQISENALSSLLKLSSNALSTTMSERFDSRTTLFRFLDGMDSLAAVIPYLNGSTTSSGRRRLQTGDFYYAQQMTDSLKNYSDLVLQEMVPGQLALKTVKSNYKLFIRSLDVGTAHGIGSRKLINSDKTSCVSNTTVILPQSLLERSLKLNPTAIAIPTCVGHNSVQFSIVSLSSKLYESQSFTSNPVTVSLSSSPCSSSYPDKESCTLDFVMQSNNDGTGTITMASVNRTVNCLENDFSNHTVSCPSHKNYTVACHGKPERIVFHCPALSLAPACSGLTGNSNNNGCVVKSYGKQNISCSCPLTHSDSSMPTSSITVVALLTNVEETFLTTIFSANELNADTLPHSWEAIVTITVFLGAVITFMLFSVYADGQVNQKVTVEEKFIEHAKVRSIYQQRLLSHGRSRKQQTQETDTENEELNLFTLVEESLPKLLSSSSTSSFKEKIWNEEKKFHRYLGIVYYFSAAFPRVLRVVSLASNIIIMLFIQSLTYNYTHNGDDGSCSAMKTEEDCLVPRSTYGTGQSRCYWQPAINDSSNNEEGKCVFIQPENSIEIMLFVAIFSGLVSAPLAVLVDWIIHHILSAPNIPTISPFKNGMEGDELLISRGLSILPIEKNTILIANKNSFFLSSLKRSLSVVLRRSSTTMIIEKYRNFIDRDYHNLLRELLDYRKTIINDKENRQEIDRLWGFSGGGNSSWEEEGLYPPSQRNRSDRHTSLIQRLEIFLSWSLVDTQSVTKSLKQELSSLYDHLEKEKVKFELLKTERLKSKRLLFLFQKDLTPGITGEILESKEQRDNIVLQPVSTQQKCLAWFFLGILDLGMLFYVFLFAISQDKHRQIAWGRSLGIYLLLDILLISTLMVIFMHVLLPAFIMRDVGKIQKKVTESIHQFYENLEKKKEGKNKQDEKESELHKMKPKKGITEKEKQEKARISSPFNAVKYLFLSYRLASLYPDLKAAQIILSYSSPWPKQDYQHIKNVKSDYSGRYVAITRTISIIVIFFLTNLLATPIAIQDMILQMASTAMIGYTFFVHIQLYYIYPALVIIPTLFICGLVFFIRQFYWKVAHGEEKNELDSTVKSNQGKNPSPATNRRQSLQQGVSLASELKNLFETKHDEVVGQEKEKQSQFSSLSSALSFQSDFGLSEDEEEVRDKQEKDRKYKGDNKRFDIYDDEDDDELQLTDSSLFSVKRKEDGNKFVHEEKSENDDEFLFGDDDDADDDDNDEFLFGLHSSSRSSQD
jgi:hypothetical protein